MLYHKVPNNAHIEKIWSVVQQIMMSQTSSTVLLEIEMTWLNFYH